MSLRAFDAAGFRNSPYVVACQVNQHHMLSTFLGVVDELMLGGNVLLGGRAAWPGSCQRPDGDFVACGRGFLAHQYFWRCTHDLEIPHVVEIHIRTRIE